MRKRIINSHPAAPGRPEAPWLDLERLAAVADRLPQVVQIGAIGGDDAVDFLEISRRMIGTGGEPLFTSEDMQAIRDRMEEIQARIRERSRELESLSDGHGTHLEGETQ